MRRAAKRDLAEPAIVAALEAAGAVVFRHLPVDLLIHYRDRWQLLEIKTPGSHPDARQRAQQAFLRSTGTKIAKTPEEALRALGAVR